MVTLIFMQTRVHGSSRGFTSGSHNKLLCVFPFFLSSLFHYCQLHIRGTCFFERGEREDSFPSWYSLSTNKSSGSNVVVVVQTQHVFPLSLHRVSGWRRTKIKRTKIKDLASQPPSFILIFYLYFFYFYFQFNSHLSLVVLGAYCFQKTIFIPSMHCKTRKNTRLFFFRQKLLSSRFAQQQHRDNDNQCTIRRVVYF